MLCKIRELYRSILEYETRFQALYSLSLNEGMLLCLLSKGAMTSGAIAEGLGLSCSNTSKVLSSVEKKGYVHRELGNEDKRQMIFSLTEEGATMFKQVNCADIELPDTLKEMIR